MKNKGGYSDFQTQHVREPSIFKHTGYTVWVKTWTDAPFAMECKNEKHACLYSGLIEPPTFLANGDSCFISTITSLPALICRRTCYGKQPKGEQVNESQQKWTLHEVWRHPDASQNAGPASDLVVETASLNSSKAGNSSSHDLINVTKSNHMRYDAIHQVPPNTIITYRRANLSPTAPGSVAY